MGGAALLTRFGLSREVWVIIAGLCMVTTGTYMIMPFFAIYLAEQLSLSASEIGVALAVYMLAAQGLTVVSGLAADRYGAKRIMCWGLILRVMAFLTMPFAASLVQVTLCAAVMGVSSAMYTPSGKAAVASLVRPNQRVRVLALRNAAGNVGVALGPVAGTWFMVTHPLVGFCIAAAVTLVCYVATVLYVPAGRGRIRRNPVNVRSVRKLLSNPAIWALGLYTFMFWAVYSQMELTMPLHTQMVLPRIGPALLFSTNAVVVIFLQLPVATWVSRRQSTWDALGIGMGIMGIGMAGMVLSESVAGLVATMLVFTLGEILISPIMDNLAVDLAPKLAATALGLMGLLGALGAALANVVSGPLFDQAVRLNTITTYWYGAALVAALAGLITVVGCVPRRNRSQAVRPATR